MCLVSTDDYDFFRDHAVAPYLIHLVKLYRHGATLTLLVGDTTPTLRADNNTLRCDSYHDVFTNHITQLSVRHYDGVFTVTQTRLVLHIFK